MYAAHRSAAQLPLRTGCRLFPVQAVLWLAVALLNSALLNSALLTSALLTSAVQAGTLPAVNVRTVPAEPGAAAIAFLEAKVRSDPDDVIALNGLTTRYLDRLRQGGDDRDLVLAKQRAEQSLVALPAAMNIAGLVGQVRVDQAGHRFERARAAAQQLIQLTPAKSYPYFLLGDAALELGRYDEAEAAFATARRIEGKSPDTESRAARLALIRGQTAAARRHLSDALDIARRMTLPVPDLIAWCSVQLGQFRFGRGEWQAAESLYQAALDAVPDNLLALEHLAELRGAQGKTEIAAGLYRQVIERSRRPEFRQALGDLYTFAGRPADAAPWYDQALAGYLASVHAGHVHYFHHLAGFFSDSRPDSAQALHWAQQDITLRAGVYALDGLAWAQYQAGQFAAARTTIDKALATGIDDAHLLYHASMIHSLAGDVPGGAALLRRAVTANPRYNAFHAHR